MKIPPPKKSHNQVQLDLQAPKERFPDNYQTAYYYSGIPF